GIDTSTIVQQLMAINTQPQNALKLKQSTMQARLSALQSLKTELQNALRSAGMQVVENTPDPSALVLTFSGGKETLDLESARAGKTLDHFAFTPTFSCNSWDCIADAMARHVITSPSIAAAMEHGPPVSTTRPRLSGKLAVLELRSYTKELTKENVQYLTDVVRQAALRSSGADVMTRENLLVLLQSSGKDLANCEGECEVDTGRRIGADEVVSGDVQRFGTKFKVSLRLHDTREGKLLSSATGTGATVDDLEESVAKAAQQLFQQQ
ncbi:MAG: flagellar cap protein FliD N-terminal domain-containing protein, partial [Myxococcales bacterium]